MADATEVATHATKPLGRKSYGSIGHVSGSRTGPGDRHCDPGQTRIVCERTRDGRDRVVCTEKADGSNVGVARLGGRILPLIRAGYIASDSRYEQHHIFAEWVAQRESRFAALLGEGERLSGEWMLQAHGSPYAIADADHLLLAFDLFVPAPPRAARCDVRLPWDAFTERCLRWEQPMVAVVSDGPPIAPEEAMRRLGPHGRHGCLGAPEGVVWRLERDGVVSFLCKWVAPGKSDGVLLPEQTGLEAVWNFPPDAIRRHPAN